MPDEYTEPKDTSEKTFYYKEIPYTDPYYTQPYYPQPIPVYEYKCPHCGHKNIRTNPTIRVVCDKCGRAFYPW